VIFDRIENIGLYSFANGSLNEAIKHILTTPLEEPYSGELFQKNNIHFRTSDVREKRFEAHKKFIDIHIVREGKEYVECAHVSSLTNLTEYDEEKDIMFGDTASTAKLSGYLEKGWVLITFPDDAHLVGGHLNSEQVVNKVIFKVPV
jgi:biofilm protein TabA